MDLIGKSKEANIESNQYLKMISNNIENEAKASNVMPKPIDKNVKAVSSTPKQKSANGTMVTPKSQSRPVSAKSLTTPVALFSPAASGRELAKLAKIQSTAERIKKVNSLKEKWSKERDIKAQLNKEKKAHDFKKIQDDADAAAALRKKAIDAERTYELLEKQRQKDMLSASLEERNQLAKDLEAKAKAKRRISVFLNSKLRNDALKNEAMMKTQKQQETVSELSDRRIDFLQLRQAKEREEQRRRESMANHTMTAQQHREAEERMAKQVAAEEAALLEMRQKNAEDDRKAKQAAEQQRRASMAGRLDHWREQKQVEQSEFTATKEQELDLLKTRHLDHQDVQQYKNEEVQRDRKSLAGRLQKWREEKVDPGIQRMADSIERELQEEALKDVKEHQAKLERERRSSLAFRLEKARKDRAYDAGLLALKSVVEEAEAKIHQADREDVQGYRQRLIEDRRASIQFRNETAVRILFLEYSCKKQCSKHCRLQHCLFYTAAPQLHSEASRVASPD